MELLKVERNIRGFTGSHNRFWCLTLRHNLTFTSKSLPIMTLLALFLVCFCFTRRAVCPAARSLFRTPCLPRRPLSCQLPCPLYMLYTDRHVLYTQTCAHILHACMYTYIHVHTCYIHPSSLLVFQVATCFKPPVCRHSGAGSVVAITGKR
jgi:hypothetical protein